MINSILAANPHITIFGIDIYYYAIIIVSGIAIAIALFAYFLKKKGYDPYDAVDYALWIIPLAILGARLYFFLFPYDGQTSNWARFWNFRDGGLGIYGAVIVGYVVGYIVARVKKQNFYQISDLIIPGLLIAQCIGRWGNFVNQEAFGNVVTDPSWQFFQFAVYIDRLGGWYQATFFYESLCTGIGFVIVMFMLRSKHYRTGWLASFYGVYYGTVRFIIEALRSDSLYLWVGGFNTGIKISQAVAIFTILFGLYRLCYIYRKELYAKYKSLFSSSYKETVASLAVLGGLIGVSVVTSVILFVVGEANLVLVGVTLLVAALLMGCGVAINIDRLRRFCKDTREPAVCTQEGKTVKCVCPTCGKEWSFTAMDWARAVFKDRQPPERLPVAVEKPEKAKEL